MRSYTHYKWLIVLKLARESVSGLFALGYHWLPIATIDLVGDNREFEVLSHILRSYTHYGVVDSLRTFGKVYRDFLLLGYHWLPIATIDLVGDN